MPDDLRTQVTALLRRMGEKPDPEAASRLLEILYEDLRRVARALFRGERAGHTLQPTILVHEACLRLFDESEVSWQNRSHFLRVAARAMRQVLIDHARRRDALKRGGGLQQVTLGEDLGQKAYDPVEMIALDEAMTGLETQNERAARVAELRLFGGLTVEETAAVLGVSKRTVDGDWTIARMWLARALKDG